MKGRSSYTSAEASTIRALLARKIRESREAQKITRNTLRTKMGFYIRDFDDGGPPFTPEDFDNLVRSGRITVK